MWYCLFDATYTVLWFDSTTDESCSAIYVTLPLWCHLYCIIIVPLSYVVPALLNCIVWQSIKNYKHTRLYNVHLIFFIFLATTCLIESPTPLFSPPFFSHSGDMIEQYFQLPGPKYLFKVELKFPSFMSRQAFYYKRDMQCFLCNKLHPPACSQPLNVNWAVHARPSLQQPDGSLCARISCTCAGIKSSCVH